MPTSQLTFVKIVCSGPVGCLVCQYIVILTGHFQIWQSVGLLKTSSFGGEYSFKYLSEYSSTRYYSLTCISAV